MTYRYDPVTGEPVNVEAYRTELGKYRVYREWLPEDGGAPVLDGFWAVSLTDTSSPWISNPPTYDPACGWCWLGVGHTADAHTAKLQEGR